MEENDAATRRFHDGSCVPQSRATRPRPDAAVACCACTQYADQPGRAAEKPKKGAKRKPALDIPLGLQSPWQEVADDVNAPLGPHPIRWGSASDCQKRESRLQALFLCVGPLAPTTKALVSRRPRGPSSRKPNPGRHGGISLARQRGGFAASHPPRCRAPEDALDHLASPPTPSASPARTAGERRDTTHQAGPKLRTTLVRRLPSAAPATVAIDCPYFPHA